MADVRIWDRPDLASPAATDVVPTETLDGTGPTGKINYSDLVDLGLLAGTILDTDAALTANSDAKVPSQKAVKAYVTNLHPTAYLSSGVTNATTTMANLTALSLTLEAASYAGTLRLRCSDSTAVDGIKFDFDAGTATLTAFAAGVISNEQGATAGTTVSAAIATDLNFTAMSGTGDHWIEIAVVLTCSVAGTIIPRMAQDSHSAGTATAGVGSTFALFKA